MASPPGGIAETVRRTGSYADRWNDPGQLQHMSNCWSRLLVLRSPILVVFSVASLCVLARPARAGEPPHFEPSACDGVPDIADVMPRLRCGVVRVPRKHDQPDGPTYGLAIVVVRSERPSTRSDPVVYISGGPGGPLTVYSGYQAKHPYAADRDLILVDQRGTGRSEPRLCPDIQVDLVTAMLAVVTDPSQASLAADRTAHAKCREQVLADGVDPDDFGTATTVEDFEWVKKALGVKQWNVFGESYGTTVAMTLMARHPGSIRSAVLDSLNPPDSFFDMPWSQRVAHARDAFLVACEADLRCHASTPDLPGSYRSTLAWLGNAAPILALPPNLKVPGNEVRLTPSLFEEVVGRLVYYPSTRASLPKLITATRDGDLSPVGAALASLLGGVERQGHEGPFIAVECRDRRHWREPPASNISPLDLELIPPGVCKSWSVLGPEPEVPQDTTVPTLVLAGQFDPNITPEESQHVADWLGMQARWILFAGIGHSVRHFSTCAQRIVAAFIDTPDMGSNAACAADGSVFEPAPP